MRLIPAVTRVGLVAVASLLAAAAPALSQAELRWGGDAEGGAPFVEADPSDPTRVVGFEVDIAQLLASELGLVPRFVQVGFTSIDASAGDVPCAVETERRLGSRLRNHFRRLAEPELRVARSERRHQLRHVLAAFHAPKARGGFQHPGRDPA